MYTLPDDGLRGRLSMEFNEMVRAILIPQCARRNRTRGHVHTIRERLTSEVMAAIVFRMLAFLIVVLSLERNSKVGNGQISLWQGADLLTRLDVGRANFSIQDAAEPATADCLGELRSGTRSFCGVAPPPPLHPAPTQGPKEGVPAPGQEEAPGQQAPGPGPRPPTIPAPQQAPALAPGQEEAPGQQAPAPAPQQAPALAPGQEEAPGQQTPGPGPRPPTIPASAPQPGIVLPGVGGGGFGGGGGGGGLGSGGDALPPSPPQAPSPADSQAPSPADSPAPDEEYPWPSPGNTWYKSSPVQQPGPELADDPDDNDEPEDLPAVAPGVSPPASPGAKPPPSPAPPAPPGVLKFGDPESAARRSYGGDGSLQACDCWSSFTLLTASTPTSRTGVDDFDLGLCRRLYRRMILEGVQPTEVTMLVVIAACSAMESPWEGIVTALTDSKFFTDTAVCVIFLDSLKDGPLASICDCKSEQLVIYVALVKAQADFYFIPRVTREERSIIWIDTADKRPSGAKISQAKKMEERGEDRKGNKEKSQGQDHEASAFHGKYEADSNASVIYSELPCHQEVVEVGLMIRRKKRFQFPFQPDRCKIHVNLRMISKIDGRQPSVSALNDTLLFQRTPSSPDAKTSERERTSFFGRGHGTSLLGKKANPDDWGIATGMISWKLTAYGKFFHSGLPHKTINPMEAMKEIQTHFPAHPSYGFATLELSRRWAEAYPRLTKLLKTSTWMTAGYGKAHMDLIPWWEIVSRLDNWSIVRASSVCKSWRDIIQSPGFKARGVMDQGVWILTYVNDVLRAWCPLSGFFLDEPFPSFERPYRVLAIEHGLVLLRCGSKSYVGNPVLMEWKEVPPIDKIFLKTDKVDEEILWSHKVLFSVDRQRYSIYVINSDWLNEISVIYDSSVSVWRIDPSLGPALEARAKPQYSLAIKEPRSYISHFEYKGQKMLEVITNNEFSVWEERDPSIQKCMSDIHKTFEVDKSQWNLVAKIGIPKREKYNCHYLETLY
ncbi:hypothetical protein SELMODRAFT_406649 [Selaginella moellendorffii]|uniref:F-box domain-containing protein n=1 Tax=Selaginella moellendorffii TaxID=88036 RepID=D8R110_SELML|nr:hypothetical protein SELMODRAFT_406649 [Selaginella moellendorffii]